MQLFFAKFLFFFHALKIQNYFPENAQKFYFQNEFFKFLSHPTALRDEDKTAKRQRKREKEREKKKEDMRDKLQNDE